MQSARSVDYQHVCAALLGGCCGIENNSGGIGALLVAYDIHTDAIRPYAELIYRCGTEGVSRRENDLFALALEACGYLGYTRGLTYAVYPDNEHHSRLCIKTERLALSYLAAENIAQRRLCSLRLADAVVLYPLAQRI